MLHAVASPAGRTPSGPSAAASLVAALARLPRAARATAWQDGLDLLALAAGLKPVCLVGRGLAEAGWMADMRRIAALNDLPAVDAAPWQPLPGPGCLPAWYLDGTARRRAAPPVLYICRDATAACDVVALSARGRVAAAAEAALLGYPPCCVAQHHRQALGLERLIAELVLRRAAGDAGRAAQLVAAGVAPLPASPDEWRRWQALTAIAPAPSTSVNMCDACAADPDGPAAALARRYDALAVAAAYPRSVA